jgi:hypothetical protein
LRERRKDIAKQWPETASLVRRYPARAADDHKSGAATDLQFARRPRQIIDRYDPYGTRTAPSGELDHKGFLDAAHPLLRSRSCRAQGSDPQTTAKGER